MDTSKASWSIALPASRIKELQTVPLVPSIVVETPVGLLATWYSRESDKNSTITELLKAWIRDPVFDADLIDLTEYVHYLHHSTEVEYTSQQMLQAFSYRPTVKHKKKPQRRIIVASPEQKIHWQLRNTLQEEGDTFERQVAGSEKWTLWKLERGYL